LKNKLIKKRKLEIEEDEGEVVATTGTIVNSI
jgi:hypothetical protein